VTLSNAATAAADASFEVNGTSYGPLAPGASQAVTVSIAPGTVGTLTVTSGSTTILSGAAYTNSCSADASALVTAACAVNLAGGGGTIAVQLSNGASAALSASFSVTATGNATSGFGPQTVGPLNPGGTQTLLIPIDASGNDVVVTVSSGGAQVAPPFTFAGGCPAEEAE
jgi:hypothetical protein